MRNVIGVIAVGLVLAACGSESSGGPTAVDPGNGDGGTPPVGSNPDAGTTPPIGGGHDDASTPTSDAGDASTPLEASTLDADASETVDAVDASDVYDAPRD